MNQVFDDFVSKKSTPLERLNSKTNKYFTAVYLLWGDGVKILDANEDSEGRIKVKSRNKIGWVSKAALGGKSFLNLL